MYIPWDARLAPYRGLELGEDPAVHCTLRHSLWDGVKKVATSTPFTPPHNLQIYISISPKNRDILNTQSQISKLKVKGFQM
jgi:hypothetical protein